MANYPNSPNYPGRVTPGVVLEFTTGDPAAEKAVAGTPVSLLNPLPVVVTAGGGATQSTNLIQVNGVPITLGQDLSASGPASLPVVLPAGYTMAINGTVSASMGPLPAGSAVIGKVGIDQTPGQNIVVTSPSASGGENVTRIPWPANTTAVVIKASPGQIYGVRAMTNAAVIGYLKIYNATSASVGVGTPQDTVVIPAPSGGGGGGIYETHTNGTAYSVGITAILTTGIQDTDASVPAANTFMITIFWK